MRRLLVSLVGAGLLAAALPAAAAPGDLDPSFSKDGAVTTFPLGGIATSVAIDHRGRVVVAGYTLDGEVDVAVARFRSGGVLDPDFGGGDGRIRVDLGGADYGLDLVVLPDDGIAVTGVTTRPDRERPFILRLGRRGAPTSTFGGGGVVRVNFDRPSQSASAIGLSAKGRFVIGGYVSNGTTTRSALARVMPDGSLDKGFAGDGRVVLDLSDGSEAIHDLLVLDGGQVVVAGEADVGLQPRFLVARLLGNGALDRDFGLGKGVTLTDIADGADVALAIARQNDGKLVLAGRAAKGDRHDWAVARYGGRGRPDPTFGGDGALVLKMTSASEEATGVVAQGARIVVAGRAQHGGSLDLAVARLKSGGGLDRTFSGDGVRYVDVSDGRTDAARAVALQPNGRIVAAGETWIGGSPRFAVVRLLAS
jgi:uncharacterized delta-60 repeat protein